MPASIGDTVLLPTAQVVGTVLWWYENPVHRPGREDRATVAVGNETWCANRDDLIVVSDPEE